MSYITSNPGTPSSLSLGYYSSNDLIQSDFTESETESGRLGPGSSYRPNHTNTPTPTQKGKSIKPTAADQDSASTSNMGSMYVKWFWTAAVLTCLHLWSFLKYRGYLQPEHVVYSFEYERFKSGREMSSSIVNVLLA